MAAAVIVGSSGSGGAFQRLLFGSSNKPKPFFQTKKKASYSPLSEIDERNAMVTSQPISFLRGIIPSDSLSLQQDEGKGRPRGGTTGCGTSTGGGGGGGTSMVVSYLQPNSLFQTSEESSSSFSSFSSSSSSSSSSCLSYSSCTPMTNHQVQYYHTSCSQSATSLTSSASSSSVTTTSRVAGHSLVEFAQVMLVPTTATTTMTPRPQLTALSTRPLPSVPGIASNDIVVKQEEDQHRNTLMATTTVRTHHRGLFRKKKNKANNNRNHQDHEPQEQQQDVEFSVQPTTTTTSYSKSFHSKQNTENTTATTTTITASIDEDDEEEKECVVPWTALSMTDDDDDSIYHLLQNATMQKSVSQQQQDDNDNETMTTTTTITNKAAIANINNEDHAQDDNGYNNSVIASKQQNDQTKDHVSISPSKKKKESKSNNKKFQQDLLLLDDNNVTTTTTPFSLKEEENGTSGCGTMHQQEDHDDMMDHDDDDDVLYVPHKLTTTNHATQNPHQYNNQSHHNNNNNQSQPLLSEDGFPQLVVGTTTGDTSALMLELIQDQQPQQQQRRQQQDFTATFGDTEESSSFIAMTTIASSKEWQPSMRMMRRMTHDNTATATAAVTISGIATTASNLVDTTHQTNHIVLKKQQQQKQPCHLNHDDDDDSAESTHGTWAEFGTLSYGSCSSITSPSPVCINKNSNKTTTMNEMNVVNQQTTKVVVDHDIADDDESSSSSSNSNDTSVLEEEDHQRKKDKDDNTAWTEDLLLADHDFYISIDPTTKVHDNDDDNDDDVVEDVDDNEKKKNVQLEEMGTMEKTNITTNNNNNNKSHTEIAIVETFNHYYVGGGTNDDDNGTNDEVLVQDEDAKASEEELKTKESEPLAQKEEIEQSDPQPEMVNVSISGEEDHEEMSMDSSIQSDIVVLVEQVSSEKDLPMQEDSTSGQMVPCVEDHTKTIPNFIRTSTNAYSPNIEFEMGQVNPVTRPDVDHDKGASPTPPMHHMLKFSIPDCETPTGSHGDAVVVISSNEESITSSTPSQNQMLEQLNTKGTILVESINISPKTTSESAMVIKSYSQRVLGMSGRTLFTQSPTEEGGENNKDEDGNNDGIEKCDGVSTNTVVSESTTCTIKPDPIIQSNQDEKVDISSSSGSPLLVGTALSLLPPVKPVRHDPSDTHDRERDKTVTPQDESEDDILLGLDNSPLDTWLMKTSSPKKKTVPATPSTANDSTVLSNLTPFSTGKDMLLIVAPSPNPAADESPVLSSSSPPNGHEEEKIDEDEISHRVQGDDLLTGIMEESELTSSSPSMEDLPVQRVAHQFGEESLPTYDQVIEVVNRSNIEETPEVKSLKDELLEMASVGNKKEKAGNSNFAGSDVVSANHRIEETSISNDGKLDFIESNKDHEDQLMKTTESFAGCNEKTFQPLNTEGETTTVVKPSTTKDTIDSKEQKQEMNSAVTKIDPEHLLSPAAEKENGGTIAAAKKPISERRSMTPLNNIRRKIDNKSWTTMSVSPMKMRRNNRKTSITCDQGRRPIQPGRRTTDCDSDDKAQNETKSESPVKRSKSRQKEKTPSRSVGRGFFPFRRNYRTFSTIENKAGVIPVPLTSGKTVGFDSSPAQGSEADMAEAGQAASSTSISTPGTQTKVSHQPNLKSTEEAPVRFSGWEYANKLKPSTQVLPATKPEAERNDTTALRQHECMPEYTVNVANGSTAVDECPQIGNRPVMEKYMEQRQDHNPTAGDMFGDFPETVPQRHRRRLSLTNLVKPQDGTPQRRRLSLSNTTKQQDETCQGRRFLSLSNSRKRQDAPPPRRRLSLTNLMKPQDPKPQNRRRRMSMTSMAQQLEASSQMNGIAETRTNHTGRPDVIHDLYMQEDPTENQKPDASTPMSYLVTPVVTSSKERDASPQLVTVENSMEKDCSGIREPRDFTSKREIYRPIVGEHAPSTPKSDDLRDMEVSVPTEHVDSSNGSPPIDVDQGKTSATMNEQVGVVEVTSSKKQREKYPIDTNLAVTISNGKKPIGGVEVLAGKNSTENPSDRVDPTVVSSGAEDTSNGVAANAVADVVHKPTMDAVLVTLTTKEESFGNAVPWETITTTNTWTATHNEARGDTLGISPTKDPEESNQDAQETTLQLLWLDGVTEAKDPKNNTKRESGQIVETDELEALATNRVAPDKDQGSHAETQQTGMSVVCRSNSSKDERDPFSPLQEAVMEICPDLVPLSIPIATPTTPTGGQSERSRKNWLLAPTTMKQTAANRGEKAMVSMDDAVMKSLDEDAVVSVGDAVMGTLDRSLTGDECKALQGKGHGRKNANIADGMNKKKEVTLFGRGKMMTSPAVEPKTLDGFGYKTSKPGVRNENTRNVPALNMKKMDNEPYAGKDKRKLIIQKAKKERMERERKSILGNVKGVAGPIDGDDHGFMSEREIVSSSTNEPDTVAVGGNCKTDKNFFAFPAATSIETNSQEDWTIDWGCKEPSYDDGVIDYSADDEDEDSRLDKRTSSVMGDGTVDMDNVEWMDQTDEENLPETRLCEV